MNGRPPVWPKANSEISKRLQSILPKEGKSKLGEKFFDNLSEKGVDSILSGKTEPTPTSLLYISDALKVSLMWLLTGQGSPDDPGAGSIPLKIDTRILDQGWPTRGRAAADDSHGSRVPDTDEFDDPIIPPEGLTCVPVQGDSMSPVILSGQFALIDAQREGFETNGGIVVASIRDAEANEPDRRELMTGTFVKRCYDGGNGLFYFTSINEYSPFSAWQHHCRIWPVIGVWFGEKGEVPEE